MSNFWEAVKKHVPLFCWKFIGALVLEPKDNGSVLGAYAVSLGRLSFLVVLGVLVYSWGQSLSGVVTAMPEGLMEVFYVLASYIFGTKVVGAVRTKWIKTDKRTDMDDEVEPE